MRLYDRRRRKYTRRGGGGGSRRRGKPLLTNLLMIEKEGRLGEGENPYGIDEEGGQREGRQSQEMVTSVGKS